MTAKVALFQLAGENHALFLAAIDRILLAPPIFFLPLLPVHIEGVFLDKGTLIPVLAPEVFTGETAAHRGSTAGYIIVCATEFGPLGLPADRVLRIVEEAAGTVGGADKAGDETNFFHFKGERYPLWKPETLIALPPGNQG